MHLKKIGNLLLMSSCIPSNCRAELAVEIAGGNLFYRDRLLQNRNQPIKVRVVRILECPVRLIVPKVVRRKGPFAVRIEPLSNFLWIRDAVNGQVSLDAGYF